MCDKANVQTVSYEMPDYERARSAELVFNVAYDKNMNMSDSTWPGPARGDAFEKLISLQLHIRLTSGFLCRVVPSNLSRMRPMLTCMGDQHCAWRARSVGICSLS